MKVLSTRKAAFGKTSADGEIQETLRSACPRKLQSTAMALAIAATWGAAPAHAETKAINVCSHQATANYNILGANAATLRQKLTNPANFGASGDYGDYAFAFVDVGDNFTKDTIIQKKCNIWFSGYENDSQYSPAELNALKAWVTQHNGQVMAGCDATEFDPVCDILDFAVQTDRDTYGFVTDVANNPLNCNGKLTSGSKLEMSGGAGAYFTGAGVTAKNVLAVHETGGAADSSKPIAIYTGNYFFTSDINMIQTGTAQRPTLSGGGGVTNNNDILTMNAFSALADASVGKQVCQSAKEIAENEGPASAPGLPACIAEAAEYAKTKVSYTPWSVAESDGVITIDVKPGMAGRGEIDSLKGKSPAEISEALEPYFAGARIPAEGVERWKPVKETMTGGKAYFYNKQNAGITGDQCGSLMLAQYTYFETYLNVPPGIAVTQFSVDFANEDMDDASRITVFNEKYPKGTVAPGSYVPLRANGTSDLKDLIVSGRNRIVLTNLDNCAHITVPKINVELNNNNRLEQAPAPCEDEIRSSAHRLSVKVHEHCDPSSRSVEYSKANASEMSWPSDLNKPSYVTLDAHTGVVLYSGANLTGQSITLTNSADLCKTKYPDGSTVNDRVGSLHLFPLD